MRTFFTNNTLRFSFSYRLIDPALIVCSGIANCSGIGFATTGHRSARFAISPPLHGQFRWRVETNAHVKRAGAAEKRRQRLV